MTFSGLCFRCGVPSGPMVDALGLGEVKPTHCYGEGDEPGTRGLIGSGFHCICDCRRQPAIPEPEPLRDRIATAIGASVSWVGDDSPDGDACRDALTDGATDAVLDALGLGEHRVAIPEPEPLPPSFDCPCGGSMQREMHPTLRDIPVRVSCPKCGRTPLDLLHDIVLDPLPPSFVPLLDEEGRPVPIGEHPLADEAFRLARLVRDLSHANDRLRTALEVIANHNPPSPANVAQGALLHRSEP